MLNYVILIETHCFYKIICCFKDQNSRVIHYKEVKSIDITMKQQLIITSLLHDVGKIYAIDGEEVDYQENLLQLMSKIIQERSYLTPILKLLQDFYQEREANLYLSRAHSMVTGRSKDPSMYKYTPLPSIFSRIDLGQGDSRDLFYRAGFFDMQNTFPVQEIKKNLQVNKQLQKSCISELQQILIKGDYQSLQVNLLALIKKYLWAIPECSKGHTSLAEHIHLHTAVTAALYDYEKDCSSSLENNNAFMLIGGDLSGIQSYIYDIAKIGEGGVSKRLRARSFFISILSDVITQRFLEALDLPRANILISTGDNFYLLAPNNERSSNEVSQLKDEINRWFYEDFQGEVYFNLRTVEFRGEQIVDFELLHEKMVEGLEQSKNQKYTEQLNSSEDFKLDLDYGRNSHLCNSCKKLWAKKDDLCLYCYQDLKAGQRLTTCNYIALSKEKTKDPVSFQFFSKNPYYVYLLEDTPSEEYSLVLNIKDSHIIAGQPASFKFYASYIPYFRSKEEKQELCQRCNDQESCEISTVMAQRLPLLFTCMANRSVQDREEIGFKSLGVLKADVDLLGAIFSIGLGLEKISLVHIMNLSRMMNYFFSGILQKEFSKKENFQYQDYTVNLGLNYIVYAGGDDLLILGPWDNLLLTSLYINELFQKYTGRNPNITLSSGMALAKPKFPIARSAKLASIAEEKAKEGGRDSFSVFNDEKKWEDFKQIFELAKLLDKNINNKLFSYNFLRRLFHYSKMEEEFQKTGDILQKRWMAMFRYDIGRNFKNRAKHPQLNQAIDSLIKLFFHQNGAKDFTIPFHWALYRNRKK